MFHKSRIMPIFPTFRFSYFTCGSFVFNCYLPVLALCHHRLQSVCLFLSVSNADHSGCSKFCCGCLHYVGCCWAMPMCDFHITYYFLSNFFSFLLSYLVMYTYPRIDVQTRRHLWAHTGTCIHLHAHMVAFILSTPQSASCGTTCLGWERGGPETNRMSRGVWTVTVQRNTHTQ